MKNNNLPTLMPVAFALLMLCLLNGAGGCALGQREFGSTQRFNIPYKTLLPAIEEAGKNNGYPNLKHTVSNIGRGMFVAHGIEITYASIGTQEVKMTVRCGSFGDQTSQDIFIQSVQDALAKQKKSK